MYIWHATKYSEDAIFQTFSYIVNTETDKKLFIHEINITIFNILYFWCFKFTKEIYKVFLLSVKYIHIKVFYSRWRICQPISAEYFQEKNG